MNGRELFNKIQQGSSLNDLLQKTNGGKTKAETQSKRGNMVEKVADLVIKTGSCPLFPNDEYDHYEGNINKGNNVKKVDNLELYLRDLLVFGKGKGGASDITLRNKTTGEWVFISSKYYLDDNKKSIDKYDVEKILAVIRKHAHKYNTFKIYLLVNNRQKVLDLVNASQSTNDYIRENIHHIIGIDDLTAYFADLKNAIQGMSFDNINTCLGNAKVPLQLRFHQKLIVHKLSAQMDRQQNNLLLGAKARSGKTYIVGGLIAKRHKKLGYINALIITPAPTETLSQFTNDLFHKFQDFTGFNVVEIKQGRDLTGLVLSPEKSNIIIVSKQLLDDYVLEKTVVAIQQLVLDLIVFDENHFHGTTDMAKHILQSYSSPKTTRLYLTATFTKPLTEWSIPEEARMYWDLEDEQMCKARDTTGLVEKHGEDVKLFLTEENRERELVVYDKMPDLHILTNMMDHAKYVGIKQRIQDTTYGFSNSTLLCGQYPDEVDMVLRYITGSNKETDYPGKDGDQSMFGRIRRMSIEANSRTRLNNGDFTTQLWFLPYGVGMKIDPVSKHVRDRMMKNPVLKKYEIKIVNSIQTEYKLDDLKGQIDQWEQEAHVEGKSGLILLAGNQLTLGITLPMVDVVFLMNDVQSSDKTVQMMYRCMTEGLPNNLNSGLKKMGFVVDLNISRVLNTLLDYDIFKKDLTAEEKITYIVERRLIHLDDDLFQSRENKKELVKQLMDIWKANPGNQLNTLLRKIENDVILLDTQDQRRINQLYVAGGKDGKINVQVKMDDENEETLQTGLVMTKQPVANHDETDDSVDDKEEEDNMAIQISLTKDVLPFIVPFSCILTIGTDNKDILEMLELVQKDPSLLAVFEDQSFIWWNKPDIIKLIKEIVSKYVKKNSTIYNIAFQFKELLHSLIDRPKELLELIDQCLKPKQLEKRKFGEVFTPIKFINDMLDDLNTHYKERYNKCVFEDETLKWGDITAGMGNYPVAVYLRLMDGLKEAFPVEQERKRHIIEKMLYMGELNTKNVFIIKQIFNLDGQYKLNLYEGDTLQLDLQQAFGIDKFDIVVGNPPYNEELKASGANALYNRFVEYYIDKTNLLSFVIPSRWFSGGKGLDAFRKKMLDRIDIVYIKHFDDASKIFGSNVSIEGGINYFLKDMNHKGDCNYNGFMTRLNKYEVLVNGKYHSLIDKTILYNSLATLYLGRYFGVESNDKRLKNIKTEETVKCYVSQQKGFEKFLDKIDVKKDYHFWKIITARANGGNGCFGNTFIGTPEEIHTGSYISFKVATEEEAKSLLSYMKCRLPNFMLSLRKNSQDIQEQAIKWIPLPPLDREWTDDMVYSHFQLSIHDIQLINDTNIVGYKPTVAKKTTIEPTPEVKPKRKFKIVKRTTEK